MRPLQITAETAQMLAKKLNVPIEHIMHMPRHILLEKIAALSEDDAQEQANPNEKEAEK
ncbi:YycC family protein [Xylanibacillus composti]|uniref:YycC family protein n=1 Tax=Xylanibacillus composti TaxID=1572762 RepID=A0A8J4M209_9BACL|nr:YycC family protein [Xylanibacillus composti]MDT9723540.1 YycC family protein [Xylanibacillus composti]GIQ68422.1 hypothetical protein XYCOK13_12460 [Xylanibacillus composti]